MPNGRQTVWRRKPCGVRCLQQYGFMVDVKAGVKMVTPECLSVHGMYKESDESVLFGDVTGTLNSGFVKAELVFE